MATAIRSGLEPLGEINTTPLIDVMLVLLVMFIITIPLQSHAVKLDLPGPIPPILQPDPVVNRVLRRETREEPAGTFETIVIQPI